ncbi:MAG: sensor histidine kinase [Anaerolineales bacterium]|nr:sensor histidine kinase [Anaerolineales bacterium]
MLVDAVMLLSGIALGWITLALGAWVAGRIRLTLDRRRYGEPVDHAELLVRYGRLMAGALEEQSLAVLLAADIPREFGVKRAVLLLPEEFTLKDPLGGAVSLPVSHAGVRWVTSSGEALRADRGRLREIIREGTAGLEWTKAWVPLMRGAMLRGMWLLGERSGGIQFSPADLSCLTNLSRQAAVILESLHFARKEQQAAEEIRSLYRKVVAAQEDERGRLARDLHDGVLQDLCAISRDLKALENEPVVREDSASGLAVRSGEAVHMLRAICHDLRPPLLQQGLAAALKGLIELTAKDTRTSLSLEVPENEIRLPDETAVAVFRIAQEALRNAVKHADASEIEVRLTEYPDRLRLTVTDDGRGIHGGADLSRFVAQGHFGLAGMRERAAMIGGRLEVQTAPDYGTAMVLELPR